MAKKSRKRARRAHKKSWLEKLLTLPVLAAGAFVILSISTVYYVSRPSEGVMGVSATDLMFVTSAERDAIIRQVKSSGETPPTFHQIQVFRDGNENGKKGESEACLNRTVTFLVNNREKTRWGCDDIVIYSKSRTATVRLKVINGFRFTGLTYTDLYYKNRTLLNGAHSVTVTGFPTYDAYWTVIDFGVHRK